ncbi:hypothetical protein LY90DRAFT_513524 [Neocallimastix californiae]|uniref:Uncharacterized protein n=1 Tax=Neocallimastix californiae TaxID=1754190 RepID=A0A1Y2AX37_9FUNG|nr:hypothetical protein LY90DRAFT_513524 [Neocallimastix californiae]|eukprot:ORY27138.1 hypothetical protein LY90DRAFT_513524 [Neocallimastix californiae]
MDWDHLFHLKYLKLKDPVIPDDRDPNDLIGLELRIKDLIYKNYFGKSTLTSCILPFARVKKKTDKNYIKIYPICHREMNRAHIQKFKLFMYVSFWHFICNNDIYAYKNELRKYGDHPSPNYNILDSILNNNYYDKFRIIMDFLYKFWNENNNDNNNNNNNDNNNFNKNYNIYT